MFPSDCALVNKTYAVATLEDGEGFSFLHNPLHTVNLERHVSLFMEIHWLHWLHLDFTLFNILVSTVYQLN